MGQQNNKSWSFFKNLNSKSGMTLIEIMIVLAIIGGLMSILLPRLTGQQDKAKVREAKIVISQVLGALQMYYTDCNRFPSSLDFLEKAPPGDECTSWGPDPYFRKGVKDPWGNSFVYSLEGGAPSVMSLGKDGKPGGSGNNADIKVEE